MSSSTTMLKLTNETNTEPIKIVPEKQDLSSEISIKQFLEFLRTAYQVTDTVEDTLQSADGTAEAVNWIKLKNSDFIRSKAIGSSQTSKIEIDENGYIKSKLDEILSEGMLDSVLPYLVPNKKPTLKFSDKNTSSTSSRTSTSKDTNKKKSNDNFIHKSMKVNSEVEIHVCDEVKKVKKDFVCSQKLLVEKMGYFAEVTAGQKLEDMDISVHCDIGIFDWLMRWVKIDEIREEDKPVLDPQCVIPILVSAAFLQMEPLMQDCLFYCHEYINEILQNAVNFNCLNDTIITRLAAMYTNTELELLKDKKDKIQSRLYCKMIASLCELIPESVRGHWCSLAQIYRCVKCEQLVMPEIETRLPCHPSCMQLNRFGESVSSHVRDTEWDINDYIEKLQTKLKSWRRVYWRLWGDAHFLYCTICNKPFPAHKLKWCCYHPENPQYFTVDSQKSPLPVGRYPCCGERAYRFQLLNNNSGCQFKDHTPKITKASSAAIYSILQTCRDIIETEPPKLIFPERLTRLVARDSATADGKLLCKEVFWWDGLQIIPPVNIHGLLGNKSEKVPERISPTHIKYEKISPSEDSSSENSSTDQSEECPPKRRPIKRKVVKKKLVGHNWQLNLSARSNQDLQRAYEEKIVSKMVQFLSKENTVEPPPKQKGCMKHVTPAGGIYLRLEQEWKESTMSPIALKRFYNNKKIRASRLV